MSYVEGELRVVAYTEEEVNKWLFVMLDWVLEA